MIDKKFVFATCLAAMCMTSCDQRQTSGAKSNSQRASAVDSIVVQSKLARLLDRQAISERVGVGASLTITKDATGIDDDEWSSILNAIRSTPDSQLAIRALPNKAHAHRDGAGLVRRHSWTCSLDKPNEIRCRLVGILNGESE